MLLNISNKTFKNILSLKNKNFSRLRGAQIEDFICEYAIENGFKLLERNFNCRMGEIDLILTEKNILVFIEVRYRANLIHGHPLESINWAKQQKIIKSAEYYLLKNRLTDKVNCRFDVVTVHGSQPKNWQIQWIKNAFCA